jgi:hypothetical protein
MAMKDLRVMGISEVGINSLSIILLLCTGRGGMVVSTRGGMERRGRGTIVSRLLEDCSRNDMIIDISRQQSGGIWVRQEDLDQQTFWQIHL